MKKTTVGAVETVEINAQKFKARIDTGAERNSIDKKLIEKYNLGKPTGETTVRSASGSGKRKLIKLKVKIKNRTINATFTIADRKDMKYRILIGRNILKKDFLVDCSK